MNIFEVLLVLTIVKVTNGQFLEQPGADTVFVSVQDQVTLTCSVEEEYIIDWLIDLVDGEEVRASDAIARKDLLQRGFNLEGVASNESMLLLRETENQTNNGTNITCLTGVPGTPSVPGKNTVTVIFYDAPPPPTDLSVSKNELGFLNISWSLGFIEGVPVNYTLTVLNLNTTSAHPIIIAGLLDQYYVFETSRPCDVYSFTVTAVTAAGNSTPSQELIFANISASTKLNGVQCITFNQSDTTTSFESLGGVELYYLGAATGVPVSIYMLIIILIPLYCCCRHRKNMNRSCTKNLESQLQVGLETTDTGDQFYTHLNSETINVEVGQESNDESNDGQRL